MPCKITKNGRIFYIPYVLVLGIEIKDLQIEMRVSGAWPPARCAMKII